MARVQVTLYHSIMLSALAFILGFVVLTHAQTIVDTEYGQVRGHVINVDNGWEQTTVEVFYGIPFGRPPVGPLRFAGPQKPDPWTGILEGDTLGNVCPQDLSFIRLTNPGWEKVGEDCLHLNIYVPTSGTGPYPVMLWLFGGAYQSGANVQYPGHFLASRGVVIVTVNYRVNKFGFAYTANAACPGNAGMLDQNLALRFVVDNIANFGGDPNRITMFGESAGAISTSLNMLSPMSNTLFQQAILQSGAETNFITINRPEQHPEDYTRQIAEQLDCLRADDFQMMDCLRSLSWENIYENSTVTCAPGYICLGMAPVVDGPGGFLPQMPTEQRAAEDVMSGPIMAGINADDGSLFLPLVAPAIVFDDCCNRTYFSYVIENNMVNFFAPRLQNHTMQELYHAMDFNYSPWPHIYDTENNKDALVDMTTDASFGVYWDRQMREHSRIAPTYGYVFDRRSDNTPIDGWLGTTHALDIIPVWGFPLLGFNEEVANDSTVRGINANFTSGDIEYSIYMQELWTNFAKFGNPTPTPLDKPEGGSTVWPEFTEADRSILYLSQDPHTEVDYRQKDYAFWNNYWVWIAGDELGVDDEWPPADGMSSEVIDETLFESFAYMFDNVDNADDVDWVY